MVRTPVLLFTGRVVRFDNLRLYHHGSISALIVFRLICDDSRDVTRGEYLSGGYRRKDENNSDNFAHCCNILTLQRYCFFSVRANGLHFLRFFHFFLVSSQMSRR